MTCVKVVLYRVIVRRCGNDDEVGIPVGRLSVQRRREIQFLFGQILFDIVVLDWGTAAVDQVDLFLYHVNSHHPMVLA